MNSLFHSVTLCQFLLWHLQFLCWTSKFRIHQVSTVLTWASQAVLFNFLLDFYIYFFKGKKFICFIVANCILMTGEHLNTAGFADCCGVGGVSGILNDSMDCNPTLELPPRCLLIHSLSQEPFIHPTVEIWGILSVLHSWCNRRLSCPYTKPSDW